MSRLPIYVAPLVERYEPRRHWIGHVLLILYMAISYTIESHKSDIMATYHSVTVASCQDSTKETQGSWGSCQHYCFKQIWTGLFADLIYSPGWPNKCITKSESAEQKAAELAWSYPYINCCWQEDNVMWCQVIPGGPRWFQVVRGGVIMMMLLEHPLTTLNIQVKKGKVWPILGFYLTDSRKRKMFVIQEILGHIEGLGYGCI